MRSRLGVVLLLPLASAAGAAGKPTTGGLLPVEAVLERVNAPALAASFVPEEPVVAPVPEALPTAEAWLAAWEAAVREGGDEARLRGVLERLPPPPAWPTLAQRAAARGRGVAELGPLVAALTGDADAVVGAVAASGAETDEGPAASLLDLYSADRDFFAWFRRRLAAAEADPAGVPVLVLPDLVPVLGRDAARPLVERTLKAQGVLVEDGIDWGLSDATAQLACEVMAADPAGICTFPWEVIRGAAGVDAWDAVVRGRGALEIRGNRMWHDPEGIESAWGRVVVALLEAGRTADVATELRAGPPVHDGGRDGALLWAVEASSSVDVPGRMLDAMAAAGLDKPHDISRPVAAWAAIHSERTEEVLGWIQLHVDGPEGRQDAWLSGHLLAVREQLLRATEASAAAASVRMLADVERQIQPELGRPQRMDAEIKLLRGGWALRSASLLARAAGLLGERLAADRWTTRGWFIQELVETLEAWENPEPGPVRAELLGLVEALALRHFDASAAADPPQPRELREMLGSLTRLRVAAGDAAGARRLLDEAVAWGAIEMPPGLADALSPERTDPTRAQTLEELGFHRLAQAEREANPPPAAPPAPTAIDRTREAFLRRDWHAAVPLAEAAVLAAPDEPDAWWELWRLRAFTPLLTRQRHDEALLRCFELRPADRPAPRIGTFTTDFRSLWFAIEAHAARVTALPPAADRVPEPRRLAASTAALAAGRGFGPAERPFQHSRSRNRPPTPGEAISSHSIGELTVALAASR